MARRGNEVEAEPLQIVIGIVQRVDFQFAAVAGTGIHFSNRQTTAESSPRRSIDLRAQLSQRRFGRGGRGDRQRQSQQILKQQLAHGGVAYRS
jgi:hypothetical protein